MKIKTEFSFILPKGLVDEQGNYKKTKGVMRLVKVKDLIDILSDIRVKKNNAMLYLVLLTRALKSLGDYKMININVIESLSPDDFTFLIDFFNEINHRAIAQVPMECAHCGHQFIGEVIMAGEL